MVLPPSLRIPCALVGALVLASCGEDVHAQVRAEVVPTRGSSPEESRSYDQLIDDAIQQYRRRRFPEARSLFARAAELYPNARVLRGLGMVELEMRHYVDSVDMLRRALDSNEKPLEGLLRGETEDLLALAQSFATDPALGVELRPSAASAQGPGRVSEDAIPVRAVPVLRGAFEHPLSTSGVLGNDLEATLSFAVAGVVRGVTVERGARVRKGQTLAVLDPTEIRAGVSQAEQARDKAERDLERASALHQSLSIPLTERQNAQTGVAVARAMADVAHFHLRHTKLVAPADGVIDERLIQVGEVVGPGQAALRMSLVDGSRVVRAGVTDRDVLSLKVGDHAEVRLDAQPGRSFSGNVSEIATTVTPGVGTFEVEVTIGDPAVLGLPTGLTAKLSIHRAHELTTRIPLGSLVDGQAKTAFVYALEGVRVRRLPVTVSRPTGDWALVSSGLEGASEVVSDGASELYDGALVRVIR